MIRIGINGMGRIGRLAFRIAAENANCRITTINDPAGDAATLAHLLVFDTLHGLWQQQPSVDGQTLFVAGDSVRCFSNTNIEDTDWSDCDVVIEASGVMRDPELLQAYLDQQVQRVVVTAPVKHPDILNIVMGVNHQLYNPDKHKIVTAASCTTNCLAPVVKVIHEQIGIAHGSITTIHNITNSQTVLDKPLTDLRRARSSGSNLIPTTTGSAKAIGLIFPELDGRLNGHSVRVPVTNASITDCVFETKRNTSIEEVNSLFKHAANTYLANILGYEERPLVSADYLGDSRSSVIDAASTMVVNGTHLKVYAWYDNEWAYANRTVEVAELICS